MSASETAMDGANAPEVDQDIVLQKSAKGDLPGFEGRLQSFLWKSKTHGVKRIVRARDTDELVAVVCSRSLTFFSQQVQLLNAQS